MKTPKQPLIFIKKDKEGNFLFREADISHIIIEASGMNSLAKVFNLKIGFYLSWMDKNDFDKIKSNQELQ